MNMNNNKEYCKLGQIFTRHKKNINEEEKARLFFLGLEFSNNFKNLKEKDKKECINLIDEILNKNDDPEENKILIEEKQKNK